MKGIFTPTEAGAVGLFTILLITMLKGDVRLPGLRKSTIEALRTSTMITMLIAASMILGHFVAVTDIPSNVSRSLTVLPFPRPIILSIIFIVYLIGGSFLDDLAFMILATPIFFPTMVQLGYNPIWLCVMISVVVGIGSVIPPVAICVFIVKNVTKVPIGIIYRGVCPFLISLVLCMVLMWIFPQIVLYLPSVFTK